MIYKVGLLPVSNYQQVPFAYTMYTEDNEWGWKQSNAFKKTFSIDVDIEFLGVWLVFLIFLVLGSFLFPYSLCFFLLFFSRDTVSSVGLIPKRLPLTTSNTIVSTFRHAISLDEHRARFQPSLWNVPPKEQDLEEAKKAELLERKHRTKPTDVEEVTTLFCLAETIDELFFFF